MDLYREQILDLYRNPKNRGTMENPTATFEEYNPLCGDKIILQLRIENGQVTKAMFEGEGCAISTAATSLLTDYIKGKSFEELKKLDGEKVLSILNLSGISPGRLKCALLSLEGLRHVLSKYQEGNNYGKA